MSHARESSHADPSGGCNRLILGDNLRALGDGGLVGEGSVDLAYLDPPFNSEARYEARGASARGAGLVVGGARRVFEDVWRWDDQAERLRGELVGDARCRPALQRLLGHVEALSESAGMRAYVVHLAARVELVRRSLRETGSLFLHCDGSAGHAIRLMLDAAFGAAMFRNEIAWCYTGPSNTTRWFPRKHDVILWYAKSDAAVFRRDRVRVAYAKSLSAARARTGIYEGRAYDDLDERLREGDARGKVVEDWWADITPVGRNAGERLGYPTQKPVKLLERIVLAASDPGAVVLDPYAGSGTTIEAVERLNRAAGDPMGGGSAGEAEPRRWIAIDQSEVAAETIGRRLARMEPRPRYEVIESDATATGARR
ncbi:MAG: DNA methyltransferase [Phycisphaerales bacterium JB037]